MQLRSRKKKGARHRLLFAGPQKRLTPRCQETVEKALKTMGFIHDAPISTSVEVWKVRVKRRETVLLMNFSSRDRRARVRRSFELLYFPTIRGGKDGMRIGLLRDVAQDYSRRGWQIAPSSVHESSRVADLVVIQPGRAYLIPPEYRYFVHSRGWRSTSFISICVEALAACLPHPEHLKIAADANTAMFRAAVPTLTPQLEEETLRELRATTPPPALVLRGGVRSLIGRALSLLGFAHVNGLSLQTRNFRFELSRRGIKDAPDTPMHVPHIDTRGNPAGAAPPKSRRWGARSSKRRRQQEATRLSGRCMTILYFYDVPAGLDPAQSNVNLYRGDGAKRGAWDKKKSRKRKRKRLEVLSYRPIREHVAYLIAPHSLYGFPEARLRSGERGTGTLGLLQIWVESIPQAAAASSALRPATDPTVHFDTSASFRALF